MCESMLGCEAVAFMTWWWIPVLEASISSRLSVMRYRVYVMPSSHTGRCAKVCWHSWAYFFIADYCERFCIQLCLAMWYLAGFGRFLGPAIARAIRMSVLFFSCFHASSEDDNKSPFQLSLVHATFLKMCLPLNDTENDDETISISWQNVLRWGMVQMKKKNLCHSVVVDLSLLCICSCSTPLLVPIWVHLRHADRKAAPAGLGLVAAQGPWAFYIFWWSHSLGRVGTSGQMSWTAATSQRAAVSRKVRIAMALNHVHVNGFTASERPGTCPRESLAGLN